MLLHLPLKVRYHIIEMKKQEIPPLDRFLVLTTIAILIWVLFDVYRNYKKELSPSVPTEILAPLDPTLDTVTLNNLKNRLKAD